MRSFIITILLIQSHFILAQGVGKWGFSSKGLPTYEYTGALPNVVKDKSGNTTLMQNDPYFLLGNYRLTLFVHASGMYQFMTGERAWARVNAAANQDNYGANSAQISIGKGEKQSKIDLIGLKSIATDAQRTKKLFGVGFAKYTYNLDENIMCERLISVKPSTKINTGNPAFLVSITLKNNGDEAQDVHYSESMLLNYVPSAIQLMGKDKKPILYKSNINVDKNTKTVVANLTAVANTFLVFPPKEQRYIYGLNPPKVFMSAENFDKGISSVTVANKDTLSTHFTTNLKVGETRVFHVVVGLNYDNSDAAIAKQIDKLRNKSTPSVVFQKSAFGIAEF